jgi:dTDP-4-amino-4,6-dideoxygalactose transaminase
MPAKMKEIMGIANRFDIPVIEDAAEALGSRFDGKALGTFGLMGVLSFNGNKIITTSGGGALISDNKELIERSRFLATQARDNAPHYEHSVIGYNYRMSNILAGIGRGQMEVLDQRVLQHRANNQFYREYFEHINGISFQNEPDSNFYSNYWLTAITVNPTYTGGITAEDIRVAFESDNIESRPLWKPMHLQPVFAHCPYYGDGTSEKFFNDGICLPSGSNLTDDERKRIVSVLERILKK